MTGRVRHAPASVPRAFVRAALVGACCALWLAGCGTAPVRPAPPGPAPAEPRRDRPSDAELLRLPEPIPRAEPRSRRGNPPFYEVFGVRYVVRETARGYVERGVASWYGPDFHGRQTSTGEPYDMYALTAAHPTLPLPAYVRVTNLANGRSVVVRVNDRGPFKRNRIIDLSYAAPLRLDMLREGTSLVEVRALEPDGAAPPPPQAAPIYAQAGAFAIEQNAFRLQRQLADAGFRDAFVRRDGVAGRPVWRVRIGPLPGVDAFDGLVERLRALGHADVRLAAD